MMPSIKQSAEYLQQMKDAGNLVPIPSPVIPVSHAPNIPSYPESPNSRLRTPLPQNLVMQPDSQRQWFNNSIPQTRLLALTPAMSTPTGSTIQSQAAPIGSTSGVGTIIIPQGPVAGVNAYSAAFTSVTTLTVLGTTHNLGTADLTVTCYDSFTGNSNVIIPGQVMVNSVTYDVTVTFVYAQSGRIVIQS